MRKNGITGLHQHPILILLPKESRFPAKSRLLPKECTRRIPATGTQLGISSGCISIRETLRSQVNRIQRISVHLQRCQRII